jgi:two-component system, chemotaxis family, protein-glutamate methylesterase/glutaminase
VAENQSMNLPKFLTVVGTSAGGMNALIELVSQLNEDMDTAVCIVMHLSGTGISNLLLQRLQPHTPFQCMLATEYAPIKSGSIYIATPNVHFLVKGGQILIGRGPRKIAGNPPLMYYSGLQQ